MVYFAESGQGSKLWKHVVLTAKDIWTEMIEDISDPSKIDEWIEKYNLTPDLEEELRKIAMNEMNKENDENG